jgi:hypothetical protein
MILLNRAYGSSTTILMIVLRRTLVIYQHVLMKYPKYCLRQCEDSAYKRVINLWLGWDSTYNCQNSAYDNAKTVLMKDW